QISRQLLLHLEESRPTRLSRKRCCEVEMQCRINAALTCNAGSSLRILHKRHGANRGDSSALDAVEGFVCSLGVAAPVIGVQDEHNVRNTSIFSRKISAGAAFARDVENRSIRELWAAPSVS